MRARQRGQIETITAHNPAMLRLQEQGLVEGCEVEFVRRAPLGDPLEVRVDNTHLTLRTQEASAIHVRLEGVPVA